MTDSRPRRTPLDLTRLESVPWGRVEVLTEAPSTNAVVAERARAGEPEGLVVVAEHQTAGRGRLDRVWVTPARSALTFSVLLRPRLRADQWPWLPLQAGLHVAAGVRRAGVRPSLKWPNDVLVGERKVAGILVERVDTPDGPAAVVGVGVNVSTTGAELAVPSATSLALEGGDVDRTALLTAILEAMAEGAGTRDDYLAGCSTVGGQVRVDLPAGGPVVGKAVDVDESARLVVRTAAGDVAVGAGDVVHVRAHPAVT